MVDSFRRERAGLRGVRLADRLGVAGRTCSDCRPWAGRRGSDNRNPPLDPSPHATHGWELYRTSDPPEFAGVRRRMPRTARVSCAAAGAEGLMFNLFWDLLGGWK